VSMFVVIARSIPLAHFCHWPWVVQVRPSESPNRLLQVLPTLFPVCAGLGVCHVIPAFCMCAP
jgi:hypothetical protein